MNALTFAGFVDHLVFHRAGGKWLIISKAFDVAQVFKSGV
jgi:hypothetical protein